MAPQAFMQHHRYCLHFSSVTVGFDQCIFASSLNHGIFRIRESGAWDIIDRGLPKPLTVNRLTIGRDYMYACTNEGLFAYDHDRELWRATGLRLPCYQVSESAGVCWAATADGIWSDASGQWARELMPGSAVYDILYLPQYALVGYSGGVALYDRLAGAWADIPVGSAVGSLAVFRRRVVGASARGGLVIGDARGGFEEYEFDDLMILNLISDGGHVYACTDRGLFQLVSPRGGIQLFPVKTGYMVTDADIVGGRIYMATLFDGIQLLER